MILSDLKIDQSTRNTGKPRLHQRCDIKCDECGKEYSINYIYVEKGRKLYNQDLCRSCKQKEQYKNGQRDKQKEFIALYAKEVQYGKTFEEMYGSERAEQLKKIVSINNRGKNNPNYGGKYGYRKGHKSVLAGKTFEELHGKEKAQQLKIECSLRNSGSNNSMYGKPSPIGSGNGWSGWYKGWHFRSLIELSYMINIIEKNNWSYENAEKKKYKIPYLKEGKERNYFGDFIINDKEFIEIKPRNLRNSEDVLLKEEAATKWCKEHNLTYRIVCDDEFNKLTDEEIKLLHDKGDIKFMDRYEEKYKEKYS